MSKVLVTGGLGFQGTHLVSELIKNGDTVYVLNTPRDGHAIKNLGILLEKNPQAKINENLFIIWGSIEDSSIMERLVPQCSTVFHLAAKINVDESIERPDAFFNTNIQGTYNILNWALKNNTRVILASTCEVYGGGTAIDENTLLNPRSPYAASKAAAERIAYSYSTTYGLPVDIVRPFNVYGPLQKDGGHGAVIGIFAKKMMNGEEIQIHGDGKQGRDFIFIKDVIKGYMDIYKSTPNPEAKVYTFGTGIDVSVNELVSVLENTLGVNANKKYVEGRKGQVTTFIAKNSLRTYFFNEGETTTFNEGIRQYVDYVKNGVLDL